MDLKKFKKKNKERLISFRIDESLYVAVKKYQLPISDICREALKKYALWSIKKGVKWK